MIQAGDIVNQESTWMQAPLKPEIIASSHPPLFTLSVYEWTSGVTEQ